MEIFLSNVAIISYLEITPLLIAFLNNSFLWYDGNPVFPTLYPSECKFDSWLKSSNFALLAVGIGGNLFLQFVQKEKYQEIILCTFKEYDIAKKFYEKRGFELFEKIDEELWYKKEV